MVLTRLRRLVLHEKTLMINSEIGVMESGPVCPVAVVCGSRLLLQALVSETVHLANQSVNHRFESFYQGPRLIEFAAGRMVFEIRRQVTGHRGERRQKSTKLVSGLAQPRCVLAPEGVAHLGESGRGIDLEILAEFAETLPIVSAGSQQDDRVEQTGLIPIMCRSRPGPSVGGDHPVDGREQVHGPDRFREVFVHAGREAVFAVLASRAGRQGDHGKMGLRGLFPLADRLDDLEAVELRHVKVQEEDVEIRHRGTVFGRECSGGPFPRIPDF